MNESMTETKGIPVPGSDEIRDALMYFWIDRLIKTRNLDLPRLMPKTAAWVRDPESYDPPCPIPIKNLTRPIIEEWKAIVLPPVTSAAC